MHVFNLKRLMSLATVLSALTVLLLFPCTGHSALYRFDAITTNYQGNPEIGEAQLATEVTDYGAGQVSFTFTNVGSESCSLTDVFFHNGALLGIAYIINGPGVSFQQYADPANLPGGSNVSPPFVTTADFSADSDSPPPRKGVNNSPPPPDGEWLTIIFNLVAEKDFQNVIADLASGELRIGLHVQALSWGQARASSTTRQPCLSLPPCCSSAPG